MDGSTPFVAAPQPDIAERERTFHRFVTWSFVFAAHVIVVLLLLAWVFD